MFLFPQDFTTGLAADKQICFALKSSNYGTIFATKWSSNGRLAVEPSMI